MPCTVSFTSREIDPARSLEVRCDFFQVLIRPPLVQHGAGGDVQRSITPRTITLVNVDPDDMRHLRTGSWDEVSWHDAEQGRTVDHAVRRIEIHGNDLKCVF